MDLNIRKLLEDNPVLSRKDLLNIMKNYLLTPPIGNMHPNHPITRFLFQSLLYIELVITHQQNANSKKRNIYYRSRVHCTIYKGSDNLYAKVIYKIFSVTGGSVKSRY